MHINTRGIVLREVNYKESDKILTVLTEEGGKRTVKARGCRRKGSTTAAVTQLLVWSELVLFEYRDYFTLNEAQSLEQFWGIKGDMEKLALASYFAEATEGVSTEGRPDPELLSLLLNSLYALDKLHKPPALVKAAFELRLMCVSGYEPLLDACAVCGAAQPEGASLHLKEGVLHCAGCRDQVGAGISLPLSPAVLAALRHVATSDGKRFLSFTLDESALEQMGDVCQAYVMTQLERGFRTLDFYKQIMG